jgi:hypothetical protein
MLAPQRATAERRHGIHADQGRGHGMSDIIAGGSASGLGEPLQPARWFHLQGTERRGPVGLDEMRELVLEGTLVPRSWVWADGMPDWLRVEDVPALVPPRALRVTLPGWPDEPGE